MAKKIKAQHKPSLGGLAIHDGPDDWNSRVQELLAGGQLEQACALARRGRALWPEHTPLINNLSLGLSLLGQQDAAVHMAQQALALNPNNLHATANLVRYLVLQGQPDKARVVAKTLKGLPGAPGEEDVAVKKAEALSYLGDDQGVVEICEATPQDGDSPKDAWLQHLGAAAVLRLGDEVRARRYWKRALVLDRSCAPARANLDDLERPPGEREGPFALEFAAWIPRSTVTVLSRMAKGDEASARHAVRSYLKEHPALERLLPVLLERGDPDARRLAMGVALMADTKPLLSALREFCLGPLGTDQLRMDLASQLMRKQAMPRGMVSLWQQGERREVLLFGSEIYFDATHDPGYDYPPEVQRLSDEGVRLLRKEDFAGAAAVLAQAHALAPEVVGVMNNLAAAWEQQGQSQRAHELLDRIFALRPDYFFARVAKARLLIRDGEVERADAMLRELLTLERLHVSEHVALCSAQIDVALARGNKETANTWLSLWRQVDPQHPQLALYDRRIKRARLT